MMSFPRTIESSELSSMMERGEEVALIDVRREEDYHADPRVIPNAVWKNPNLVTQWSNELPKDKKVVVYCVRGGSVSNAVLDHLLTRNLNASYIKGGMTAWKEDGGTVIKEMDG